MRSEEAPRQRCPGFLHFPGLHAESAYSDDALRCLRFADQRSAESLRRDAHGLLQDRDTPVPTLEDLETAIADYKRTQTAFSDLVQRRDTVAAQLNTIDGQIATAKANAAANEQRLREVTGQFSTESKRGTP